MLSPIVIPRCSILIPHPPHRHHYCHHHHYHHPSVLSLPEVSGLQVSCSAESRVSPHFASLASLGKLVLLTIFGPFVLALPGNLRLLLVSTPLARGESPRSLSRCGKFRVSKSRHEDLSLLAVAKLLYEELQLAISTVFEASLSVAADFWPFPIFKVLQSTA
jgi:hypothetical protein